MKNVFLNAVGVCAMLSLMASCSSTEDIPMNNDGYGTVSLNILTDTQFESRAVDESYYQNLENYTVTIMESGKEAPIQQWKYGEIPEFTELLNGTYVLSAICGDSTKTHYSDDLCVLGSKVFTIYNDSVNVEVACKPNSARVNIVFDEKMDEYFSAYKVNIKTAALNGAIYSWEKTTTGPVYFRVKQNETVTMTIELTPKEGIGADTSIEKTYTLSPADAMKMTLTPVIGSGNLSITIEIDDTVIEHPVDIEVPSEWA